MNHARKLNNHKSLDGYRPHHVPRALKVIYGEESPNNVVREEQNMPVPSKQNMRRLPLLPIRGLVVYPGMLLHLDVGRQKSVRALEKAKVEDSMLLLCSQSDISMENPSTDDIYRIGTIAKVRKMMKLPNGSIRILVEGIIRAEVVEYLAADAYYEVNVREKPEEESTDPETDALMRTVLSQFERYINLSKKITPEALAAISVIDKPGRLADVICHRLSLKLMISRKSSRRSTLNNVWSCSCPS